MNEPTPYSKSAIGCAASVAVSNHLDARTAATEIAHRVYDELDGDCDAAILFGSFHHCPAFAEAGEIVRRMLEPQATLGVTGESVLGADAETIAELEGRAGLSLLGLRLPGANLFSFTTTPDDPIRMSQPETISSRIGLTADHRATLLLADPFTCPMRRLLPAITACGGDQPVLVAGGMASGANQPGRNVMLCDDQTLRAGGVGITISGDVNIDFVVSQGCRPIGETFVVTKAKDNIILELGGRKAIDVAQEMGSQLSARDKAALSNGLLIGTVIDERKGRFGRGDFLIRSVLGFDPRVGGVAIGDEAKMGRTVQFHVRDAETGTEDLQLLLDKQMLHDNDPFASLLFTCNSRGSRLFGKENHDLNLLRGRFEDLPIAGFHAAGEIGPIGEKSYLHGHTASAVLFRER